MVLSPVKHKWNDLHVFKQEIRCSEHICKKYNYKKKPPCLGGGRGVGVVKQMGSTQIMMHSTNAALLTNIFKNTINI
jgi:hypothetical protein